MKVDGQQSETNVVECDDVKMPKRSKKEIVTKRLTNGATAVREFAKGKKAPDWAVLKLWCACG